MQALPAFVFLLGLSCCVSAGKIPVLSVDAPATPCPPLCDIYCKYGNVIDEKGCPTCECKPNPCTYTKCPAGHFCNVVSPICAKPPCDPIGVCVACPPVKCQLCEFGYVLGANGCQTCECKPNPCQHVKCAQGQFCTVVSPLCKKLPCDPIGLCVGCPLVKCIPCKFGYVVDANGCQTCKCKPNPCHYRRCGPGETCTVIQPLCITSPCDPISKCVPNNQPSCEHGSPLTYIPNCGRGGERCPDTHYCNIHPTDVYAVCCLKKPDPCATHYCARGTRCAVQVVPCFVAPCPEEPVCVPLTISAELVKQ